MIPRHVKSDAKGSEIVYTVNVCCARISFMEQDNLLHTDRHKSSFNFTLALSIGIAVVGLLGGNYFLVIVGLAVAAFSWFTTPAQYTVWNDRLVIGYGKPRIRQILFQDIDRVEQLKLPIGTRLRVVLRSRRPIFIQPRDPDEFQDKLQVALDGYLGSHLQERADQGEERPDWDQEQPPQAEEPTNDAEGWESRE